MAAPQKAPQQNEFRVSHWKNKTVVVTGGSAGFGLALAAAFGSGGASLVLVARNSDRLKAASDRLSARRIHVRTLEADVTSDQDVDRLETFVRSEFGRADVLVNAAGKSDRGRAGATTVDEFQSLWDVNFLSTVRCTTALMPMVQDVRGSIVNIGSLASKTAGQYLGAYPVSKHAVAAYSQQLRLELAEEGVHVMLVCPGPIRRDDAGNRYGDTLDDLPKSAARPGGSKLKGLDPDELARRVANACVRRRPELVVPGKARLLFAISQLSPSLGDWILRRATS